MNTEKTETTSEELLEQEYYIEKLRQDNEKHFAITGKRKKHYTTTFGCQANEHDTEKIAGILESIGYEETKDQKDADIIIYNTCLIRENAALKVYGHLGELVHLKKKNPDMLIGICGCMMQQEEIRDIIKKKYRHVDLVFGTHNFHKLPELISDRLDSSKMTISVWEEGGSIVEGMPAKRKHDYTSLVNITYGCNNFCTYCVVPYTRGREKSREASDIVSEITELSKNGCKEVTLLGQNVNSYGKTLENECSFADLLRKIDDIEGIKRIKFMTSHPKDLSDDLIYAIRDSKNVSKHVHLPVQSGSNDVLKAMNRKYTREDYLLLVSKLKKEVPDIAISTDIIVGFPGETESDFEDTLDLIRQVKFDSAYTFIYSIREGTPAAEMTCQIDDKVKHERFNRLMETLNPIVYESSLKLKDTIQTVLVENSDKNDEGILTGRTESSKSVHFKGDKSLVGQLLDVKIDDVNTWSLKGSLAKNAEQ